MAFFITIVVILLVIILARNGREAGERESYSELSANDKEKVIAEKQQTQQETDELITVILPTINNDN